MTDSKDTLNGLLPCPFCGSRAVTEINAYGIRCTNCWAEIDNQRTAAAAKAAWNLRDGARSEISGKDWNEDFSHENGNYQNRCVTCQQTFIGHKRRQTCKLCANSEKTYADEGLLEVIRCAANNAGASLTHRMAEKAALAAFDYLESPKRESGEVERIAGIIDKFWQLHSIEPATGFTPQQLAEEICK